MLFSICSQEVQTWLWWTVRAKKKTQLVGRNSSGARTCGGVDKEGERGQVAGGRTRRRREWFCSSPPHWNHLYLSSTSFQQQSLLPIATLLNLFLFFWITIPTGLSGVLDVYGYELEVKGRTATARPHHRISFSSNIDRSRYSEVVPRSRIDPRPCDSKVQSYLCLA